MKTTLLHGDCLELVNWIRNITRFHSNGSIILLMPKLDELLNGTEEVEHNEEC